MVKKEKWKKPKCPICSSTQVYVSMKNGLRCNRCGWNEKQVIEIKSDKLKTKVLKSAIKKLDQVLLYDELDEFVIIFSKIKEDKELVDMLKNEADDE
jgi:ribosomal protein S27AE